MSRVHWIVSGRVQGVGFRWFVYRTARRHGISGDVRNLADGSVELRACGESAAMEPFLSAVRCGPPGSRVDKVDGRPLDDRVTFGGFDVRH